LSQGRWALESSAGARVWAHSFASLAGSSFFFFGLVALQGVLLNLLRPRAFGRVTGYLQGCLVALMLSLIVLSFSIQPQITNAVVQPEWARWLPPVWFLGLCQTLSGDPDPGMRALAGQSMAALGIAVALALLTYLAGYHRHRALLAETPVEGLAERAKDRRWHDALLGCLVALEELAHNGLARCGQLRRVFLSFDAAPRGLCADPRQQAVLVFMMQTLARSSHHRMILMGYGGLGFAVLLTGLMGMAGVVDHARIVAAGFVYFHLIALLLLLLGARHLFSLPTNLKANWIFQITEREGCSAWLNAVDRFALFWGAMLMLVIPLPVELWLLGWLGMADAVLFAALGLVAYEWLFSSWEKLPFTCSHLPGKTPMWILVVQFFGLISLIPVAHSLLLATLYNKAAFLLVLAVLLAAWTRLRRMRRQNWLGLRLKYDETPEPAVHGLNLLR
ncbi:MAG: hypothetical protein ACRD7E_21070, partial [Bryobacteraceae bacterium]